MILFPFKLQVMQLVMLQVGASQTPVVTFTVYRVLVQVMQMSVFVELQEIQFMSEQMTHIPSGLNLKAEVAQEPQKKFCSQTRQLGSLQVKQAPLLRVTLTFVPLAAVADGLQVPQTSAYTQLVHRVTLQLSWQLPSTMR